jgi:hypothetical protein
LLAEFHFLLIRSLLHLVLTYFFDPNLGLLLQFFDLRDHSPAGDMLHEFLQIASGLCGLGDLGHLQVVASEEIKVAREVEVNESILEGGLPTHVEVALYHNRAWQVLGVVERRVIFHEVIFPVKVVVKDSEVPWFWPETELGGQNMLVGKVEQTDRPFFMVTLKEVLRIIEALIHNRSKLV